MAAKPQAYCDLVMKGGITSGIVYPRAVLALAGRYRFKNIGGTSAGAIAAAICAAAALGDRRRTAGEVPDDSAAGFGALDAIAGELCGAGFIYNLFQPAPRARPAFRLVVMLAAHPSAWRATGEVLLALVRMAGIPFVLALALLLGIGWLAAGAAGLIAVALPGVITSLLAACLFAALRVAAFVRGNLFGLCPGTTQPGSARNAGLTDWMHAAIQRAAGSSGPRARPVTFGDLWSAPRYDNEPKTSRALNLEVITTSVSHSEPRTLPFAERGFWFCREEFAGLFPAVVVEHMIALDNSPLEREGRHYHRLPDAADLPILVAARMSLSFPLLICAIPLYERDFVSKQPAASANEDSRRAAQTGADARRPSLSDSSEALTLGGEAGSSRTPHSKIALRRCWFTDGGVASNFPIHLFDSALPRWPTFAINLIYPKSLAGAPPPAVRLPPDNRTGWQRRYNDIARPSALGELGAFVFGIIATMQNWRDLLQSRAPGHRERIVDVPLSDGEGGMNLAMPERIVQSIAQKGSDAGKAIIDDFSFGNHHWIRYRNAMSGIERFAISFAEGLRRDASNAQQDALDRIWAKKATPGSYSFSEAQAKEAHARVTRLSQEAELWADDEINLTDGAPRPLPHLRITPSF